MCFLVMHVVSSYQLGVPIKWVYALTKHTIGKLIGNKTSLETLLMRNLGKVNSGMRTKEGEEVCGGALKHLDTGT